MSELHRQVSDYLDGEIDAAAMRHLCEQIRSDPANARAAAVLMLMHTNLTTLLGQTQMTSEHEPIAPASQQPRPSILRSRTWRWAAAAVLLISAVGVMLMYQRNHAGSGPSPEAIHGPGVAMLTDLSPDAVFTGGESRPLGSTLSSGDLDLQSGTAQIMFNSTAVVDLSGPCRFEMIGPNRGRLTSGFVEAYVPQAAHGFTIDLPGGHEVVDLGTRFGLLTGPNGNVKLRVDEGSVEFRQAAAQPVTRMLHAGDLLQLIDGNVSIAPEPKNLLVDGDFEHLPLGAAKGWLNQGKTVEITGDGPLFGSRCVRIPAQGVKPQMFTNVYQWVLGIKPGEHLRLIGHVRTDAGHPLHAGQQVFVRLNFYRGPMGPPRNHIDTGMTTASELPKQTAPAAGTYQTVSVDATVPPTADRVQVVAVMMVNDHDRSPSPVYVDDMRLYRIDAAKEPLP